MKGNPGEALTLVFLDEVVSEASFCFEVPAFRRAGARESSVVGHYNKSILAKNMTHGSVRYGGGTCRISVYISDISGISDSVACIPCSYDTTVWARETRALRLVALVCFSKHGPKRTLSEAPLCVGFCCGARSVDSALGGSMCLPLDFAPHATAGVVALDVSAGATSVCCVVCSYFFLVPLETPNLLL